MNNNISPKDITDYFRNNIFESLSSYSAWKMIYYSRSKEIILEEMVKKYVEVQGYHSKFFQIAERAFLVHFVVMCLHSFDERSDSYSLYKVDKERTNKFAGDNKDVISKLKNVRHKLFAHRDNEAKSSSFQLPSIIDLDKFFKNLIKFYNELTILVDQSSTTFMSATEIKRDIEFLFMNLYRGESIRKKEIDLNWEWEKDSKKASDVL